MRGAKAAPRLGVGRAATLADFDLLASHLPALAGLNAKDRQNLASQSLVTEADGGTVVVAKGDTSDAACFILSGRAVAGYLEEGSYQLLEVLNPGDFFGEIASLTGIPRTANVNTEEPTLLLQVPAAAVRQMMVHPQLNRLFLSQMTERMVPMNMIDMPRYSGLDQQALRELRTRCGGSLPETNQRPIAGPHRHASRIDVPRVDHVNSAVLCRSASHVNRAAPSYFNSGKSSSQNSRSPREWLA